VSVTDKKYNLSEKNAMILLTFVIIARSTSFVLSKSMLESMSTFNLLAVRFLLAFLILAVIFPKKLIKMKKRTFLKGLFLGFIYFVVMSFEIMTLNYTASNVCSFLEHTAVIMVPVFSAMISRKKPAGDVIIGAVLAFLGIGLLSFSSGSEVSGTGVALALSAAFSYAWAIIITDKVTKEDDALTIGMLQVGFMGLFGLIASMIFESPHLPQTGTQWAMIIYLAAVCSDFGFTFQTVGQSGCTPEQAGLIAALNPVFSGIFGWIFLNESLTFYQILGGAVVVFGIILPIAVKLIKNKKQTI